MYLSKCMDDLAPWGRRENEIIIFDNVFNESIDTDVNGIQSDGFYAKGFNKFPIFNVTEDEFRKNLDPLRQRCRFKTQKVVEYIQKSRYKQPFYIKTNIDGKDYIRRIK